MKHDWKREELEQQWTLFSEEQKLLKHKTGPTRLGFAVLMKYFQVEGRFPENPKEVPQGVIDFIANQLGISGQAWLDYSLEGRPAKYQRS